MTTHITKLTEYIGVKVDLTYQQAMSLSNDELRDLLFVNKVLVFKNWLNLTPVQIVNFGKKFGTPWTDKMYQSIGETTKRMANSAYTDYNNKSYPRLYEGIPWHVDIANEVGKERYPSRLLYCVEMPSEYVGLTTDISSMVSVYNRLSAKDKAHFENVYLTYQSWQKPGTNIKELSAVEVHPYTKEKFLRLNAVSRDEGWIRSWFKLWANGKKEYYDNDELRTKLDQWAEQNMYSHEWSVGDLVIFDNWGTVHRKGAGEILPDSTGLRRFVRISVDNGIDPSYNIMN